MAADCAEDKDAITSALAEPCARIVVLDNCKTGVGRVLFWILRLKAEGKTVRETSHLYASARANFG